MGSAMHRRLLIRLAAAFFVIVAAIPAAKAQVINTFAGGVVLEDQPATSTPLNLPRGLAVDLQGNLYIAETAGGLIRRVDATTGIATIIAGGGTQLDDARPIPGRQALLDGPTFPAVDGLGNVYFCDTNNHRIRKIAPDGMITTVVGTGIQGFSGDGGPATRAQLSSPEGLYVDAVGNLFVSDTGNGRVRLVTAATGIIQTFAGGGTQGDGSTALNVRLENPRGLTFDRRGNLFIVTDRGVRKIDKDTGLVTTVAGGGQADPSRTPAPANSIRFCDPYSVAVDEAGNLYVPDCRGLMRVTAADGLVAAVTECCPDQRSQAVLDRSGNVFFTNAWQGLVFQWKQPFVTTPVAGTLEVQDGLFATAASLSIPESVAVDRAGNLFIADTGHYRIRKVDRATGIISTIAGTGAQGGGGEGGAATQATFFLPHSVYADGSGNIFMGDNGRLRRVDAQTGLISTLMGGGQQPLKDGTLARDVSGNCCVAVTGDPAGNIYAAVSQRVVKIEAGTGILRFVAGNGTPGNSGDGGLATSASLFNPTGVALDGQGNLLIASCCTPRLRQVNLATGVITSGLVDLGGGQGGVAVDSRGTIYVSVGSRAGVIAGGRFVPIAGSGQRGFFGDGGIPTLARLSGPRGVAVDSEGSLYIADLQNSRIRKVTALAVTPVLAVRPSNLTFTERQGQSAPSPQGLTITGGNLIPLTWTAEVSIERGGNWLAASPTSGVAPTSVLIAVNPANLAPGAYQGAVNIISPGATGSPQTISVTLNVQSTNPPAIGLSQQFLSFTALQGGASPPPQTVSLTNTGGGTLNFAVQTEISGGGAWLQVTSSGPTAPATLTVRANSTGLAPGLYQGLITIRETSTGEIRTIAVSLLVSRAVPILQVSQTGLLFLGVEGSLSLRPQTFLIQNRGQAVMSWRIQTSVAGAGDWLRATPDRGSSDAARPEAAPSVTVTVEPAQLRAGVFSGLLTITAEGAPNSPFVVLVLVSMQPAGSEPLGLIQPAGLIFTAPVGAAAPLVQEVTVSTTGGRQLQFLAGVRTQSGGNWLSLSPTSGTLLGSTESVRLQVTANPAGLAAGVYVGALTVSFGTGLVQDVAIALVVAPATATVSSLGPTLNFELGTLNSSACTPARLVMVETQLVQNFRSNVGWPTALLVQVVDDCAQRVTDATVLASFSNGDPALLLNNLRNGSYSGTWVPTTPATQVTVTLNGLHPALGSATVRLSGALATAETPILFRNGAVSGASFKAFAPLAPGAIFSVFGRNLERAPVGATQVPLPRKLGEISVKLGEVDVPLIFVGPGQVNAQVPFELPTGTTASLVVKKGELFTTPEVVTIVPAQPAIFSVNQAGSGQGAVLDGQFRLVEASNPVAGGEVVQIYATGLGMTNPAVATGAAAPESPPARVVVPVTVTIGGREAAVEFAGLAPGFVGLYQVNARVPAGVAASPAVPLVLTQSGIASNTVTIAIR